MNELTQYPLCEIAKMPFHQRIIAENEHAFLIRDGCSESGHHSFIIPKCHIGSFFETTERERAALLQLVDNAKSGVDNEHLPDAYNIGISDGPAAEQTVLYLHLHLIPRYEEGDDPKGGMRWLVPEKVDYWSE
ncbi:MAG: HIT family protein [Pseudomonadales bacterium]